MAVQQNKKSPSKRGMHRSHNALALPGIAVEPTSGEVHLRHHISPNAFYRGRQVLKPKSEACLSRRAQSRLVHRPDATAATVARAFALTVAITFRPAALAGQVAHDHTGR